MDGTDNPCGQEAIGWVLFDRRHGIHVRPKMFEFTHLLKICLVVFNYWRIRLRFV